MYKAFSLQPITSAVKELSILRTKSLTAGESTVKLVYKGHQRKEAKKDVLYRHVAFIQGL